MNRRFIVITALWYSLLGFSKVTLGIESLIRSIKHNTGEWWAIQLTIGILVILGDYYLVWGKKKTIKYITLILFISWSLFEGSFILAPHTFGVLGELVYVLYYLTGIVLCSISIKRVKHL